MSDEQTEEEVQGSSGSRSKRGRMRSCSPNPLNRQAEAEDQLSAGSKSAQEAVSNDLVLNRIFGYLRTEDLVKRCRRVNKQWNRVATDVLKKRTDAYVALNASTDFEALTACIRNSSGFPFREIALHMDREDFENSPEEWLEKDLFRQYSTTFTRLRLKSYHVPDIVLWGLFSGPFAHIESLTLERTKRKKKKKSVFVLESYNNHLNLANLKEIKMGNHSYCYDVDPAFLEALLQSSPNLVVAQNFTNAQLPAFSKAGKLGIVKSLRVCPCVMRQNKKGPRPTEVEKMIIVKGYHHQDGDSDDDDDDGEEIEGDDMKFACLQPLLESNRQTLRHIEVICRVVGGMNSANWPKFTKLTSLKLMGGFYFPDCVEEVFPALETLQLFAEEDCEWFYGAGRRMWKEPLFSVTKLELSSCLMPEDWEGLVKAVPHVHTVVFDLEKYEEHREGLSRIGEDKYAMDFWNGVSHLKQLQEIRISPIQLDTTNVDQFLTGIPEVRLKRLRANPQWPVPDTEFVNGMLRKAGSVASLPDGVEELVLCVQLSDTASEQDLKNSPSVSYVALQYGFNMAPPDLKIRFMYDHQSKNASWIKDALSPVSDRVTFEHWNTNLGQ